MNQSTNLELNLPELADQYDLDHWNENMNIIDEAVHELQVDAMPITNEEIDTIMQG